MKTIGKIVTGTCLSFVVLLGGCADMTKEQKNTAIGAGVGGVAGSVLTNGSATGTIGGAAVGGVIGNQVGKGK
jgi:osmotically inducible lipoprotein OsmB